MTKREKDHVPRVNVWVFLRGQWFGRSGHQRNNSVTCLSLSSFYLYPCGIRPLSYYTRCTCVMPATKAYWHQHLHKHHQLNKKRRRPCNIITSTVIWARSQWQPDKGKHTCWQTCINSFAFYFYISLRVHFLKSCCVCFESSFIHVCRVKVCTLTEQ
jgi:hypothetical protein